MAIQFIPNDPRASAFNIAVRRDAPRRSRPTNRAQLVLQGAIPEQEYAAGTAEFLHWQCREAALTALGVFETVAGPVTSWARSSDPRKLDLLADDREDLNAYYDGEALVFCHATIGPQLLYTGASTDVVAHETGHALLDVLRPDLWFSQYLEANAFHESFGDCMAILTALADPLIRQHISNNGLLSQTNCVETVQEELAWGISRRFPTHNGALPRRSRNNFRWTLPTQLPKNGPAGDLIAEEHSFAQIFTGAFYDLIVLLAEAGGATADSLAAAAETAAKLLFAGARNAPEVPRFFQAVGRAMALDASQISADLHQAVGRAFAQHGIALGSAAMVSPRSALSGTAHLQQQTVRLSPAASKDVRERFGVSAKSALSKRILHLGAHTVAEVSHAREVPLSSVAPFLRGVRGFGTEPLLVSTDEQGAVMSAVPDATETEQEVRDYISGLVIRGQIETDGHGIRRPSAHGAAHRAAVQPQRRSAVSSSEQSEVSPYPATHRLVTRGGIRRIERLRFACGA